MRHELTSLLLLFLFVGFLLTLHLFFQCEVVHVLRVDLILSVKLILLLSQVLLLVCVEWIILYFLRLRYQALATVRSLQRVTLLNHGAGVRHRGDKCTDVLVLSMRAGWSHWLAEGAASLTVGHGATDARENVV